MLSKKNLLILKHVYGHKTYDYVSDYTFVVTKTKKKLVKKVSLSLSNYTKVRIFKLKKLQNIFYQNG